MPAPADATATPPPRAPKARGLDEFATGRYEAKYLVPPALAAEIRAYIAPYCVLDPHCRPEQPEYVITTLQLDTPSLALHYAKLWDTVNRFKLRVRTYGDPVGDAPVFVEIKAKQGSVVTKRRARIPFERWGEDLFAGRLLQGLSFATRAETDAFYQFASLVRRLGARPVMLIRYHRQSFVGTAERYSRVTFDTRLQYQQTRSWTGWGHGRRWYALDNPMMQTRRHDLETGTSNVVLELKTLMDVPRWMVNLAREFGDRGLARVGHCKYSNAVWANSMFRRTPWPPEYEIDLLKHL